MRLSIEGFTPTPCTKHCAVVLVHSQTSRRNYSLPTIRSKSADRVDLPRASTGQRSRRQRQIDSSVLPSRPALDSQQSVETVMTELQTLGSDGHEAENENSAADGCCNACTSTLRRSYRVASQPTPFDDTDTLFNSSREHLIVQPDLYKVSAFTTSNQEKRIKTDFMANCSSCVDTNCSCHHGADNPTFVSDNVTLHRIENYAVSENGGCLDHVNAAQALMQPLNGQRTAEPSDLKEQVRSDAAMEMACYSLRQNGNRLVIEDLESDSYVASSDTTLMELNGVSHPPMDVREAWPDNESRTVSRDSNLNDVSHQLPVCIILYNH